MTRIPEIGLTPRLVLNENIMRSNIARMADMVGKSAGVTLRPHFKTAKMIEVARAQIDAGAIGHTCATVAELEALHAAGMSDLFWAHQPVGRAKVAAALSLAKRAKLRIALDSVQAALPLSESARAQNLVLDYMLEIDAGLGRAGVLPENAVSTVSAIARLPNLNLCGVFTHEGHLYGTPDVKKRAIAGRRVGETMVQTAVAIRDAGFECETVSVGSTPSSASAPFVEGVTEARPGTYVFYDDNQTYLGACTHDDCAVSIVARVVSRPRKNEAIIDAGIKAMSSDKSLRGNGFGFVHGFDDIAFPTAYEEHGLLVGTGADTLNVGDLVKIIPNHVCGAVNMWSKALIIKDGTLTGEWNIVARH